MLLSTPDFPTPLQAKDRLTELDLAALLTNDSTYIQVWGFVMTHYQGLAGSWS